MSLCCTGSASHELPWQSSETLAGQITFAEEHPHYRYLVVCCEPERRVFWGAELPPDKIFWWSLGIE